LRTFGTYRTTLAGRELGTWNESGSIKSLFDSSALCIIAQPSSDCLERLNVKKRKSARRERSQRQDLVPSVIKSEKLIGEHEMPLTTVIIAIVAVGLLLWLVNRFIPMQGQIKSILNGVVVIVLVLWLANLYGLFDNLRQFRVGR
jgi:hypothetical protein